jgi:2-(1,2-epoxy-1,2-dihydrophenyl)acetyl-CoA isomerase
MHGMARAMGMCLLADPVPAEQAAQWGLIWQPVDDDQLDSRAAAIAHMWAHT